MGSSISEVQVCHIHGPTLALMLHDATMATQDADGLLFGQFLTKQIVRHQDDDVGVITIQEHHVYVTGYVSSATSCSFSDGAGRLQAERLKALLPPQRDPLIGWLSIRPGTTLQPSMREVAVTQQLQSYVAAEQGRAVPIFLMLLSTQPDHQSATITMQYRVLQSGPPGTRPQPGLVLMPVGTAVTNLARSLGQKGYDSFEPVMPIAQRLMQVGQGRSLEQSADALVQQVANVEELYQGMLRELQVLCRDVSSQTGAVAALHAEGRQLLKALASLNAAGRGY